MSQITQCIAVQILTHGLSGFKIRAQSSQEGRTASSQRPCFYFARLEEDLYLLIYLYCFYFMKKLLSNLH